MTKDKENGMSQNRFQHVDIRVNDMEAALAFYKIFLPELGFTHTGGKTFQVFDGEGTPPRQPWFGFIEDRDHRANTNRIAFWADSRAEVDRLAQVVREAGGGNISGPRDCPEYTETYYAVFFEDPSGNCLEICFLTD